jgi:hypothetical protein
VSGDRIPLNGDRATTFDEAFEKRRNYIHAEAIDLLIDGAQRVPLPGCPECGVPAEQCAWSTYDRGSDGLVLEIDVDPCGHRFRTAPAPERFL